MEEEAIGTAVGMAAVIARRAAVMKEDQGCIKEADNKEVAAKEVSISSEREAEGTMTAITEKRETIRIHITRPKIPWKDRTLIITMILMNKSHLLINQLIIIKNQPASMWIIKMMVKMLEGRTRVEAALLAEEVAEEREEEVEEVAEEPTEEDIIIKNRRAS
jgi:hypothetical protein